MLNVLIIIPEITKGMKSIGSKSLLKIKNNIPILEYQIQQIKHINHKIKICVSTGFEGDRVAKTLRKYKVDILHNPDYSITNQAKCVEMFIKKYSPDNMLLISNGILFRNQPFDLDNLSESKIFLIDKPKINFNIGCAHENDNVNYLFYDLPVVWSECVFLNRSSVELLENLWSKINMNQMYLFEVINTLILNNAIFHKKYISKKDIMKINNIKDLNKAKTFI